MYLRPSPLLEVDFFPRVNLSPVFYLTVHGFFAQATNDSDICDMDNFPLKPRLTANSKTFYIL